MAIILLFTIVTAGAMIGDRTGVGGGSGGKTAPDGSPIGNEPIVPVDGACPSVQTVDQLVKNWCGVASSAQVISFWQGNWEHYSSRSYMATWGGVIRQDKLSRDSGKSYQYTNDVNKAINSLKSGKPVIAYTALYGFRHIIALTCYDDASETFTANDSEPRGRGGQQSVQRISGVPLTKSNLTGHYSGTLVYGHPMFLVTN